MLLNQQQAGAGREAQGEDAAGGGEHTAGQKVFGGPAGPGQAQHLRRGTGVHHGDGAGVARFPGESQQGACGVEVADGAGLQLFPLQPQLPQQGEPGL